ncbi:conserved hypothetical protein [Leishmania braziliensis MHOM/BR/75/M2904]|uniref:Conserved oligomeric Golgi complex subunit 1 n=2 Tax=Leishmania braziliensis TaxID=5660 RepID=A4H3B1_LEIBR|nr:conserved hypothetical protein [Leishmania braziliensis MHOM/BR/75/M2904]CAJ2465791.1 unnamed protein product [Leishmania braziliensis]CAM41417.2 conserved hypothetical protein [Leishmania braziliensis MHOM/BR/75/M2904]
MTMEEAAQEVRRILCQNDVGEALHYLSTVARSIEANQHDLRAVIGNSYRDLLGACDGVVGMERDCADILTIEEAMERLSAARDVDGCSRAGAADSQPLLPPSWFATRLRRQRRVVTAAPTSIATAGNSNNNNNTSSDTPSHRLVMKGYATTSRSSRRRSEGNRGANASSATNGDCGRNVPNKTELDSALGLPIVELPLPPAGPTYAKSKGAHQSAAVDGETGSVAFIGQRMYVSDELQALHLDYMALESATASMGRGTAAVDAELSSLLANSTTLASLLLPTNQLDERQDYHDSSHAHHSPHDAAALAAESRKKHEDLLCALERDLPLLRLARRLRRVQAFLLLYADDNGSVQSSMCIGDAPTASSVALADVRGQSMMRSAKQPPSWVTGFQRRVTALETRLVKLMLLRLRRAADDYAWLVEQRDRLAGQMLKVETESDLRDSFSETRTVRAAEKRHLMYVWVTFAQFHGALRALRGSPTLVNALVACAPGAALPGKSGVRPSGTQDTRPAASSTGIASLEGAVDALYQLASQDVQSIVSAVVGTAAAPVASAAVGEVLPGVADPSRMLLAFLAVLLLRESQLSAVRWTAVAPSFMSDALPSSSAQPQTATYSSSQPSSFLPANRGGGGGGEGTAAAVGRRWSCTKSEGDVTLLPPTATSTKTRVFATATHLSALGLVAATADHPATSTTTPVAVGDETSNTAWALRCFSGLSFLLRAFADYVDLVQAASAEVPPATAGLHEETVVLSLLQRACVADEEASGEPREVAGHVAGAVAGAQSLDELLQWRLRNACGSAAASGVPEDSPGTPLGSFAATDTLPSSLVGRSDTPMRDSDGIVAVSVALGVAPSQAGAVTRRRAYVELLRASVNTVDELQASVAPSMAVGERPLSSRADAAATEDTSTTSEAADLVPLLRLVCHQLLAPCVSSLVVLLARDPVVLAGHSEGQSRLDTTPAMHEAREALRQLLQDGLPHRLLSGARGPRIPSGLSGLGQTWATVDTARWWELVEQTTVHAALQRCVTVALESVSFVEVCISQGLIASALCMLQGSVEGSDTEHEHHVSSVSGDGNTYHGFTGASALENTWPALFSVLRLHALSTVDSASGAGVSGSLDGSERASRAETGQRGVPSFTGSTTLAPIRGHTGRRGESGGLSSAMAGIRWARFRPRAATGTAGSAHGTLRVTSGEGIFSEEGLEWGRAACRAARLPLSGMSDTVDAKGVEQQPALDAAAANAGLSASQQAQLAAILSGMRDMLFPDWEARFSAEQESMGSAQLCAPHMNGHAAELLHRCLLTLVEAVQAQTAAVQASAGDGSAGSPPSTLSPPPPLHMRIERWLKDALHRVAAQLRNTGTGATPNETNAAVVHSYELSLLVRVYLAVLQALRRAAPPSEETRLLQLCAEAEDLYERTQAPWQAMIIQLYRTALQQAYTSLLRLRESGGKESASPAVASRAGTTLRRMTHLYSAAWVRAPMVGDAAPGDSSASGSHGIAYPAQPTPAVMMLTQTVLRYLHQALYGVPTVFSDSPELFMPSSRTEATHDASAASRQGQSDAASAAASVRFSGARRCGLHMLVMEKERRRVLERLAETSAEVYEFELCPLVDVVGESGDRAAAALVSVVSVGDTAPTAAAATQSQADHVRLQWYMDVLFTSSVWCAGRGNAGSGSSSSAGLFATEADSPAMPRFTPDAGRSGVRADAAASFVDGPLRRVARHLESTCDPVRWRSGAPLVLSSFHRFISASAHLWVAHSEESHEGGVRDTCSGEALHAPSVAAAVASKPFAATSATAAAPFSAEQLLFPRERVNRLALLPIAVSSNAALAAAAASVGSGGTPSAAAASAAALVPQTYLRVPQTASELSLYQTSSSTGVLPTEPFRFGGASSAAVAVAAAGGGVGVSSLVYPTSGGHDASPGWALGGLGESDVIEVGGATAPAGSTSAAASAASALWGTTQRGWGQLWGTG